MCVGQLRMIVWGFFRDRGTGVGGDLGNLAKVLVDLSILLVHSMHKIVIATMLVRLAGLFPCITVMM